MKLLYFFLISLFLLSCKSYINLNKETIESFDLTFSKDPLMYHTFKNYNQDNLCPFIVEDDSVNFKYNYEKSSQIKHSFSTPYFFSIENVSYTLDVSNPRPFYYKNGYIFMPHFHNFKNYKMDTLKLDRIKLPKLRPTSTDTL
jgi:hypothetical protein